MLLKFEAEATSLRPTPRVPKPIGWGRGRGQNFSLDANISGNYIKFTARIADLFNNEENAYTRLHAICTILRCRSIGLCKAYQCRNQNKQI